MKPHVKPVTPEEWMSMRPPQTRPAEIRVDSDSVRVGAGSSDAQGQTVRVLAAGDWAAVREFERAGEVEPRDLYGSLASRIAGADLAMVNLECPLGGGDPVLKDGPNFRCDPACADALARAGFDLATLANNHILDHGVEGVEATRSACRAAGLATVGAGVDAESALAPLFLEVRGLRVAVLALSEDAGTNPEDPGAAPIFDIRVLDRCREARRHADALVVVAHGGKEYSPFPPGYWYDHLLALASAGADAVVGHHPHVPQGVVWVEREAGRPVPVVCSTGNFVFPPRPPTDVMSAWMGLGYLVSLDINRKGVAGVELIPYRISPPKGVRGLSGEEMERFAAFMRGLSGELADRKKVDARFDDAADYFWDRLWRERVEGLTEKMCRDDIAGLRHGRSHFQTRAHTCLIDRVIQRKLEGRFGDSPPERVEELRGWFEARWPVDGLL